MSIAQLGQIMFGGGGGNSAKDPGLDEYLKYQFLMKKFYDEKAFEQQQAENIAGLVDKIYGTPETPDEYAPAKPELFPGEEPIQGLWDRVQEGTKATGLFAEPDLNPIQQLMLNREYQMMKSGNPQLQAAMLKDQNILMSNLLPENKVSNSAQIAQDLGLTPGSDAYKNFIREHSMKSGITIDQGNKYISPTDASKMGIPDGKGGYNPLTPGMTWADAQASGAEYRDSLPADSAGKAAMLATAKEQFPVIEQLMFNEDGTYNPKIGGGATALSFSEGIPFFKGAVMSFAETTGKYTPEEIQAANRLANAYEMGIQAITRTETGAAMPQEELANTRARFQPSYYDDDATARQKWMAYQRFIELAAKKLAPTINSPETLVYEVDKLVNEAFRDVGLKSSGTPSKEKFIIGGKSGSFVD